MAPGGACRGAGPADGTGRVRGRQRPTRVGGLARARDPRSLAGERKRRGPAVSAWVVGGRRRPRHRLRQPERIAPGARGPAAIAAPRLPGRPGRRPVRPSYPRRGDVVSDQARPGTHGPNRRPQPRDPAREPRDGAHTRDGTGAAPSDRGRVPAGHGRAGRSNVADALGPGDAAGRRGDRLVGADGPAPTPGAGRGSGAAAAGEADRRPGAVGIGARRCRRLRRGRARRGSRPRTGEHGTEHRDLVRRPRLEPRPRRPRHRTRGRTLSRAARARAMFSTRSPTAVSRAWSSRAWAT